MTIPRLSDLAIGKDDEDDDRDHRRFTHVQADGIIMI